MITLITFDKQHKFERALEFFKMFFVVRALHYVFMKIKLAFTGLENITTDIHDHINLDVVRFSTAAK
jgi:hypothetical protein